MRKQVFGMSLSKPMNLLWRRNSGRGSGFPCTSKTEWSPALCLSATMWPVFWTAMRTYAPYVTFPVAFVVGAVGYHLEWFIRGKPTPNLKEEKGILELREDRKLQELVGQEGTQFISLKERLEFTPKAALERNRPEKS